VRRMAAVTAKQVLIAKVLREADSSHVQISAVEKKMLYFTEGHLRCPPAPSSDLHFHRNCSRFVSSSDNILAGDPLTLLYDPR